MDLAIVLLSIMGITLEEIEVNASLPINPTIIRIMRVLRIARGDYFSRSLCCLPFDLNRNRLYHLADCFSCLERTSFFVISVSASA